MKTLNLTEGRIEAILEAMVAKRTLDQLYGDDRGIIRAIFDLYPAWEENYKWLLK